MRKVFSLVLCVLLLAGLSVMAFAEDSPQPTVGFQVVIVDYETGEPETQPVVIVQDGGTIEITIPEGEKDFSGFIIEGDYEIVSGSLDGTSIIIRPLGDIVIHETFEGIGPTTAPSDTSPISPPTGTNNLVLDLLFVALLLGGVGAAIAVKKLATKKSNG